MSTRILHCSTSVENHNICIEQKVAGFSNRGPQPGDLIYLAAKVGKKTLCTARFILDKPTNFRPWADGERYVHALQIRDIQYCAPFDLNILSHVGGKFWGIKYFQGSKPITDNEACDVLNHAFTDNQIDYFIPFDLPPSETPVSEVDIHTKLDNIHGTPDEEAPLTRDSIKIQAMLADIGDRMGYGIWLPKSDRSRVLEVWQPKKNAVLNDLPLNYDLDTIKTIENIDVLWIKGRTIVRAYEVEHTTSIYSGILRMADLMALQPNLNINAHIIAPEERKVKVMQELSRPVFRYILANTCTFISYSSIEELANEKRLEFMTDAVLNVYSESVKDYIANQLSN